MKLRTTVLAGGVLLLAAGGAAMASGKLKTMQVDLHDGTAAQIEYAGDVAPKVTVVPTGPMLAPDSDPFAGMDRMFAEMEARQAQMMQQVAEIQRQASASGAQPGQVVVSTNAPAGSTYHYTVVSTTSGKGGTCTQTVEYSSDGKGAEPKVTRASSGDCDAVKASEEPIPAAAPKLPEAPKRDPNMTRHNLILHRHPELVSGSILRFTPPALDWRKPHGWLLCGERRAGGEMDPETSSG